MRYLFMSSLYSSICSSVVSSLSSCFLVSITFVFLFFHLFSLSRHLVVEHVFGTSAIFCLCTFLLGILTCLCVFACLSFLSVFFFEEKKFPFLFLFCVFDHSPLFVPFLEHLYFLCVSFLIVLFLNVSLFF